MLAVVVALTALGGDDSDSKYLVEYDGSEDLAQPQTGATPAVAENEVSAKKTSTSVSAGDLGNLVISGISGLAPSEALLGRIERGEVGGVIIMGENVNTLEELKSLTTQIRDAAKKGGRLAPLITVDQEGGDVKRFLSAAPNESAAAMSARSAGQVQGIGAQTGKDLRTRGANVDLAPIADVVSGGGNFLGTRAFKGGDLDVATKACAFAAGLRLENVGATLKHFPGLGRASSVNTDDGAVSISASRDELRSAWGAYSECASEQGTMVMVSSAAYPNAYGNGPAVLESAVYKDIRKSIGFDGPVITDALNAVALQSVDNLAVNALAAGADILLYVNEAASAKGHSEVEAAFKSGELKKSVVATKVARVKALREQLAD